jgi:hypothetical protein
MDNVIWGVAAALGIVVVLLVISLTWEVARSAYFTVAAKWYGWDREEKFERTTARERRIWARDEQNAKRDEIVAGNLLRRRTGVTLATFAIAELAFHLNVPWWHARLITVGAGIGLTMVAGLSFRW